MNKQDYSDIKNMLLDEYKKARPSFEEQKAYVTGMTRYEQALLELKEMLMEEYDAENPEQERADAFWFGMQDLEAAITGDTTEERLNDYLPVRISNEYLKEQLLGCRQIISENEELRKANRGYKRKIENDMTLSKSEISQLKKENEYIRLTEELKKCRAEKTKFQDMYYSLLIERYNNKEG